jgi:hypothetical protein
MHVACVRHWVLQGLLLLPWNRVYILLMFLVSFHSYVGFYCLAFVCRNSCLSSYWWSKALICECVRTHVILLVHFLLYISSKHLLVLMLLWSWLKSLWSVFVWGLGLTVLTLMASVRLAYSSVVLHPDVLSWSGISSRLCIRLCPSLDPLSRILFRSLDLGFINVLDNISTISSVYTCCAALSDRCWNDKICIESWCLRAVADNAQQGEVVGQEEFLDSCQRW